MKKLPLICFVIPLLWGFCASISGQELTPAEKQARIQQAMPTALPQSPAVAKTKDASDFHLRGQVKDVILSKGSEGHLLPASYLVFDRSGARLNQVSYNGDGNPMIVAVFGYIDGKRVAKTARIAYSYDPPAAAGPAPESGDTRYNAVYENVYGHDGKLMEEKAFLNSGKLYYRKVYTVTGPTTEILTYNSDGEVTSQLTETYDSNGDIIEAHSPGAKGYGENETHYAYEKYDSKGNWTRRVLTGKIGGWRRSQKDFTEIHERVITYYP